MRALYVFALVMLVGTIALGNALGQKPTEQIIGADQFEPFVIEATPVEIIRVKIPKPERCTICNFKTPLIIEAKVAKKQKRNSSRTAYANAVKTLKSVVAMITEKSDDTVLAAK